MRLPQIRLQSQMAKINITQTPASQQITQRKADMSIKQPSAELSINTTPSKLTIDQTQAWEDLDLMSILKRNTKFANEGSQALFKGMARRARQGKELMRIEQKGDPLITQAVENSSKGKKDINVKFIPSPFSVKTDYRPSEVNISVRQNKPIIQATPRKPEHVYQPGTVNVEMKQDADLQIDFINLYT